jgi:uncharacterized membrane protein
MKDQIKRVAKPLWAKGLQYFLQGLLVVAPVAITIYIIYTLTTTIDAWIPIFSYTDANGVTHNRNYGLGIIILIALLIAIGYVSSFFIKSKMFNLVDDFLEKTPGIKFIYSTSKDMFGAFAGNKKKFDKPVLVSIEQDDVYRIGFITDDDVSEFGLKTHVTVYLPAAYSISGYMFIVPYHRVKPIDSISAADAMKYAISGGVADVDEAKE